MQKRKFFESSNLFKYECVGFDSTNMYRACTAALHV